MSAAFAALIDTFQREQAIHHDPLTVSFAAAVAALHKERFTGAVTLHFAEGVPKRLDLPRVDAIRLQ